MSSTLRNLGRKGRLIRPAYDQATGAMLTTAEWEDDIWWVPGISYFVSISIGLVRDRLNSPGEGLFVVQKFSGIVSELDLKRKNWRSGVQKGDILEVDGQQILVSFVLLRGSLKDRLFHCQGDT